MRQRGGVCRAQANRLTPCAWNGLAASGWNAAECTAQLPEGKQGHLAEMVVEPLAPLPRMVPIMQWCLPFLRQHAGRLAWASGASSGQISAKLKSIISEMAAARRMIRQPSIACKWLMPRQPRHGRML